MKPLFAIARDEELWCHDGSMLGGREYFWSPPTLSWRAVACTWGTKEAARSALRGFDINCRVVALEAPNIPSSG